MSLRTTMLTSAFATAVAVAACSGSNHKKVVTPPGDDAGAAGTTQSEMGAWFQSLFREAAQRKILFDLGQALQAFEATSTDAEALLKLRASYQNLQRRWLSA